MALLFSNSTWILHLNSGNFQTKVGSEFTWNSQRNPPALTENPGFHNMKNITWLLGDTKFLFWCLKISQLFAAFPLEIFSYTQPEILYLHIAMWYHPCTHPPCFTLVLNSFFGITFCCLHKVNGLLNIVFNPIYHLSLKILQR